MSASGKPFRLWPVLAVLTALLLVSLLLAGATTCHGAWCDFNPPGSQNGNMLEDVLSRSSKTDYYRQKYANDLATMCHECTHQVNECVRRSFGNGIGIEALYVGGGKACVLRQPRVRITDVAARAKQRFRNFNLYLVQQPNDPVINSCPLYLLDEWVAATNGAYAAIQLNVSDTGDRYMSLEFSHYANALLYTVAELDPSYPDLKLLEDFIRHEKDRVRKLESMGKQPLAGRAGGPEYFVRAMSPQQCATCIDGSCYQGGGWQPVAPPRQVVVQPPQPRPIVPNSNAFDGSALLPWREQIERRLVQVETRLTRVEADAKGWSSVKGERGPAGPQGPAGPAGPPGPPGKPGDTPPIQQGGESHIAVVVDRNATWWPRLAVEIEKTRNTYSGIQVSGLPNFPIGEIPQAVVYENSVPVRVVKGERAVLDLLSRVRQGVAI